MSLNADNISIKPMRVYFGENVTQVAQISFEADVSSSLNNDYFFFYDAAGVKHYGWFDVNSAGTDPAPGGTGHEIDIAVGATAAQVAAAAQAVLDAVTGFDATVAFNVVTLTATTAGLARAPHRGVGLANTEFKVTRYGSTQEEVGFCDGEITVTSEEQAVDVTAHQTGGSVIAAFTTGRSVEASITLKETSAAQLKRMFLLGGGDSTSGQGATGTEVFGYGTDKVFQNQFTAARKLYFHPVQKPAGDKSEDITFPKAYPLIGDLTFSGEEVFNLPITFKCFPDFTKVGAARYMIVGDGDQTFTL